MNPDAFRTPLSFRGQHVTLRPLDERHAAALLVASHSQEVGRFLTNPPGRTEAELRDQIAELLRNRDAGTDLPFVQVQTATDRVVGMTRYLRIDRAEDHAEIGGTWLEPTLWRTPVNTEAKYLLLRHAFEVERVHRMVLQTDLRNERSQRAIARIGALREGVLREDRPLSSGYRRSSVIFAILAGDWPRVRRRLESMLARPWDAEPTSPSTPRGR